MAAARVQQFQHAIKWDKAKVELNLMSDPEFLPLRKLDSLYRKLHSAGIGSSVRKTEVLNDEDEEKVWASGVLNPDTLQGLLKCAFFLNGKNFCLRGGIEHRELKLSQYTREVVTVNGKKLKNRSGRLKQLHQANKTVHQYESEDIPRCHVLLLDKYIAELPAEAKAKDIFHMKPKIVHQRILALHGLHNSSDRHEQAVRDGENNGSRK